ncbi:MAG: urea ABC transporter ATP-binding subunit UrtE [Candidatus Methylumidiphilus sp.]
MLKTYGLNQFYGESHILWDVELTVPKGQCTCLMGRNGVGKTTLLKCVMGLLPIKTGAIELQSQDITALRPEKRAGLKVGFVPQGREIFPLMTVEENLQTGLGARADKLKKIPEHIFEIFPVLKSMLKRRGGDLSGGQQQQLAIGRALVLDPQLLILDEPTEGIQPNIVHEIGDVILRLNKEMGVTVLLVEQKLPFARRVGDRFFIMEKGRGVATGHMTELDDEIVKRYLSV